MELNIMTEEVTEKPSTTANSEDTTKKIKALITEAADGPLTRIQQDLKDRGIKSFDLNQLISEALQQVPAKWWEEKLEELTPIEFKLQQALEDPDMREKIISLLGSQGREVKGGRSK
jgi:hypothetical protein